MGAPKAGSGLKAPTAAECLDLTGCSAAELSAMAGTLPIGTLTALVGDAGDDEAAFRLAAAEVLAGVDPVSNEAAAGSDV